MIVIKIIIVVILIVYLFVQKQITKAEMENLQSQIDSDKDEYKRALQEVKNMASNAKGITSNALSTSQRMESKINKTTTE